MRGPKRGVHVIPATLRDFARSLGLRPEDADEGIRSERAARAVLSRRSLLAAAGAMATSKAFGFAAPEREPFFGLDRAGGARFLRGLRVTPEVQRAALSSAFKRYAIIGIDRASRTITLGEATDWSPG